MKKIMFNDRYGLTQAVLEGRKTMTRRQVPANWRLGKSRYYIDEVVAVSQSYADCGNFPDFDVDEEGIPIMPRRSGFFNKMFVRADLMPHRIQITSVRVERLQDISDEDCLREGIRYIPEINKYYFERTGRDEEFYFSTPREAFAALIDKVSGRGTWESNTYVVVYGFELVK
jgi:hypothetical protein